MPRIVSVKSTIGCLAQAVEVLERGGLVAIPTETVYGLAGDATNSGAVAKIFAMKQRPSFNPLICHVDGLVMAHSLARMDKRALALAHAFWPGPVTLVLEQSADTPVDPLTTGGLSSVAIRHPRGVAGRLAHSLGRPLAAPSANLSGQVTATRAQDVAEQFHGEDLLILDDGPCPVGMESTIVDLSRPNAVLLRPGGIVRDAIESVLECHLEDPAATDRISAPGQLRSHYAPRAIIRLNALDARPGEGYIAFGSLPGSIHETAGAVIQLSEQGDLVEAASHFFQALADLDKQDVPSIAVAPIPTHGLGEAINDRLKRAAAPRATGQEGRSGQES